MIDRDELMRRAVQTKYDIFPLDKLCPFPTVYRFLTDEYQRHADKSVLMSDRKYQRLREGYFALFVGVVLAKEGGGTEYLVRFPASAANDIDFLSRKPAPGKKEELWRLICDVKEFTSYSGSFTEFVEKAVVPKIKAGAYHVIIGLHEDVLSTEMVESLEKISSKGSTIWVVSNPSREGQDFNKGVVVTIQGPGLIRRDEVDLSKDIPAAVDPPVVYQDILRDKLV